MNASYESDVVAWADEQVQLIRAGRLDKLDLTHIAEEIEDVGKSEQRELAHRVSILLMHLLKWEFQPNLRSNSWTSTIREQRRSIARRLDKTPSLQKSLTDIDWLEDVWLDARNDATKETGIEFDKFPVSRPWELTLALQQDWFPSEVDGTTDAPRPS